MDYYRFVEKVWVPTTCGSESQTEHRTLLAEYGPWAAPPGEVTAPCLVRALLWVDALISDGHAQGVVHGTRLESAILLFLNRPSEGLRRGGKLSGGWPKKSGRSGHVGATLKRTR